MKFVFDRAVKGRKDGHDHFLIETFEGQGPWERQGNQFPTAKDWLEHAKGIGRALGITECECGFLPPENDKEFVIFSFKNFKDHMAFTVAACGNLRKDFAREIKFSDPLEKQKAVSKISYFLEQNEIDAQTSDETATSLRVATKSRFDDFAVANAALNGHFSISAPDYSIQQAHQPMLTLVK